MKLLHRIKICGGIFCAFFSFMGYLQFEENLGKQLYQTKAFFDTFSEIQRKTTNVEKFECFCEIFIINFSEFLHNPLFDG